MSIILIGTCSIEKKVNCMMLKNLDAVWFYSTFPFAHVWTDTIYNTFLKTTLMNDITLFTGTKLHFL